VEGWRDRSKGVSLKSGHMSSDGLSLDFVAARVTTAHNDSSKKSCRGKIADTLTRVSSRDCAMQTIREKQAK
jgi:hypothetical protein